MVGKNMIRPIFTTGRKTRTSEVNEAEYPRGNSEVNFDYSSSSLSDPNQHTNVYYGDLPNYYGEEKTVWLEDESSAEPKRTVTNNMRSVYNPFQEVADYMAPVYRYIPGVYNIPGISKAIDLTRKGYERMR